MLNGSITYVLVIIWGVWVLRGDRIDRESPAKVLVSLVFTFYVSRLIAATFFPFPIEGFVLEQGRALSESGFGPGNNFVPFYTVADAAGSAQTFINQIVGNFILLFPLGFLAPLLFTRFTNKMQAVGLVIATTLGIELLQLGISTLLGFTYRSFDVDDLWLNAVGGIFGVVVSSLVFGKATWLRRHGEPAQSPRSNASTDSRETVPYRSGL